jgi:hypothetical protein
MNRAVKTTVLVLACTLACSASEKGAQGGAGDGDATGSDGATEGDGDGGDGGDDGDAGSGSDGGGDDGSATGDDGGGDSGGTDGTSDGGATGGGGDLPDCGFDPGLSFNPTGDVLQLQSADESVCVRIERRDDGPGDARTIYTLLEMQVGPLGEVSLIDDQTDLCWHSSHHNFLDWAHAWAGSRHYDVKLKLDDHGGNRTYELHTFEQGPIDPDECPSWAEPEANGPIGDPIELFPYNP